MAQQYDVLDVKKRDTWTSSYGEQQSYALSLKGISEPVKLDLAVPVADEPKKGDTIYGVITPETINDRQIWRLQKMNPPAKKLDREAVVQAEWAIRLATEVWMHGDYADQAARTEAYNNIEQEAVHFNKMISNVIEEMSK